jgi:hypothetical protein
MSEKRSTLHEDIAGDLMPDVEEGRVESYSVVLESIRSEIETLDSFSLKFSVLLKMPVTRMKHVVKRLPATLWKGKSRSKAKMLVELAEEAGGVARIVENRESPRADQSEKDKKAAEKVVCSKCGFPLKKDDVFCNFCMTSIKEKTGTRVSAPVVEKQAQIPTARLFFYFVILLMGVILAFVLR